MRILPCLLTVALLSAAAALAAASPPALVSRDDLRADLDVLRRALEALHPGIDRDLGRAGLRRELDRLERALDRNTPRDRVYAELARFLATLRCGHTHANPSNQGKLVTAEVLARGGRTPFEFRWLDGRMIVTRDLTPDARLPRGTEVLAIADVPAAAVLRRLMPVARADGGNDAKRISDLEVRGRSRWETFDVHLPLVLPEAEERMRLRVRRPGGRAAETLEVAALADSHRARAHAERRARERAGLPWTLDLDDPGFARLTMASWSVYDRGVKWDSTLDAMVDQAIDSGRPALVVDLRGNEGGLDVGTRLLERLVPAEARLETFERLVRYRKTPADLDSMLDTWDDAFRDRTAETDERPDARGFYRLRDDAGAGAVTVTPRGRRFAGRVFVLVDEANSSATFQFARAVRALGVGTLVGRTTGGNRRGINGGAFFFLRLPRSRVEVDVPLIGYFPTRPEPDAGIVPDLPVRWRAEDVAAGVDPDLEAVRRALGARRRT